jgi:type II secretory pathway pseudopilin PulG
LIVLAIIALVSGIFFGGLFRTGADAKVKAARMQVQQVVGAAARAMFDEPGCPDLESLVRRGYLRKAEKDPWGTPLTLRCPAEHDQDPVDVA